MAAAAAVCRYTRNLIFKNEHMDVLLMCWPPHCTSAIHDHEESSCFVGVAEGQVVEVQYTIPVHNTARRLL